MTTPGTRNTEPLAGGVIPRIVCLTVADQRERQSAVVRQFEAAGLRSYEFHPGFTASSAEVAAAYAGHRVKRYPECFRCGARDCGRPDCNNVLLPAQVAVALGFQAIFRAIAASAEPFAAICEDDIVFAGCARDIFESERFRNLLDESGLRGAEPALLRLGRPSVDAEFPLPLSARHANLKLTDEIVMSNYFFLVNKAFARLAESRLQQIDHTADTIIHSSLVKAARCRTLNVQLVADRSWSLGEVPSLIHPKAHHLEHLKRQHGETSARVQQEAERIRSHVKKSISVGYCITGSPRCGSHFVSAFLRGNGIDVGHERLGAHGICAWQYAVSSDNYPYVNDPRARSDFFVHAERWFLYARNPLTAIPSLMVENRQAPLSYAFRREAIARYSRVNLDDFPSPVERAARSYAHWYELALRRQPIAILRVENFLADCRQHLRGHEIRPIEVSAAAAGSGKPYLGIVHKPPAIAPDWIDGLPMDTRILLRRVATMLGYEV